MLMVSLRDIAELADRAAFLLDNGEGRADLLDLANRLDVVAVGDDDKSVLSRCARVGTDYTDAWLVATAARCRLVASGAGDDELGERLTAISWAWGHLPRHELDRTRTADEDALGGAALLDLETLTEKLAREGSEA